MAATSVNTWANASAPNPLLHSYVHVRQQSLDLIKPLSAEDCALQAAPFVSPAKWHLAHTTWFFETFILKENGTSRAEEALMTLHSHSQIPLSYSLDSLGENHRFVKLIFYNT